MGLHTFENVGHHIENEFTSWYLNGIEKYIHSNYSIHKWKEGIKYHVSSIVSLAKLESHLSRVDIGIHVL